MCESIEPGLEIVVENDTWNAYGPITPRSFELFNQLVAMGGISGTVAPGVYIFNMQMLDNEHAAATLSLKE